MKSEYYAKLAKYYNISHAQEIRETKPNIHQHILKFRIF